MRHQLALRHQHHAIGIAKHGIQAVLGEDHRQALGFGQVSGELHQLLALLGRQARRGFVHQHHAGFLTKAQGQLQPLDPAIRHGLGAAVGVLFQAQASQPGPSRFDLEVGQWGEQLTPPTPRLASGSGLQGQLHLSQCRHGPKHLRHLKAAAHAQSPQVQGVMLRHPLALHPQVAGVGGELPIEQIEGGGFAGAIGAHEGQQFTGPHLQAQPTNGLHATKRLAQPRGLQQHRFAHAAPPEGRVSWGAGRGHKPAKPSGKRNTSNHNNTPMAARQCSTERSKASCKPTHATAPIRAPRA